MVQRGGPMGSKANPAAIGAFVVGALALAVIGVLLLGSGRLFRQTSEFVCFFSGDVSGLRIGAPVQFMGVEVGSVIDVRLRMQGEDAKLTPEMVARGLRIPVLIEIDNEKLSAEGARTLLDADHMRNLIDLGLRAQLVSQSFVTGLLQVQLGFHPDMPATYFLGPKAEPQEIPTIPTSIEQVRSAAQDVIRKLEEIHLDRLVAAATDTVTAIQELVQSPALQGTVQELPATVANMNQAVTSLRELVVRLDREQGPLLTSLRETSEQAEATLQGAQVTIDSVRSLVASDAPLMVDLASTLQEFRDAARSVRLLADTLERDPSALVRGRYVEKE
jgi:paraquat-inducible protein B